MWPDLTPQPPESRKARHHDGPPRSQHEPDPPPELTDRADHEYEQPWWVGHPIVKYPGLALVATNLWAWSRLDGDAQILVGGALFSALLVAAIVSGILLQRGVIRPLPNYPLARFYPPAGIICMSGFVVTLVSAIVTVVRSPGVQVRQANPGIWVGIIMAAVGFLVQILSWDDMWPDRWRPAYLRRHPPADDVEADDLSSEGRAPGGGADDQDDSAAGRKVGDDEQNGVREDDDGADR
jgi:hypothetical protein